MPVILRRAHSLLLCFSLTHTQAQQAFSRLHAAIFLSWFKQSLQGPFLHRPLLFLLFFFSSHLNENKSDISEPASLNFALHRASACQRHSRDCVRLKLYCLWSLVTRRGEAYARTHACPPPDAGAGEQALPSPELQESTFAFEEWQEAAAGTERMNEEECFVLSQSWFHLMPREDRRADTSASFNFESCSPF